MKTFSLFFPILLIFSLSACAMPVQKLDPSIFYKRDMDLNVNGRSGEGVLVLPQAAKYEFDISSKGKLDLFTFTTCHREQTREKAGGRGWFADKKRRKFNYVPTEIENGEESCPAHLGGYEKNKGRHSWALVDFEHPSLKLSAELLCNGSKSTAEGVSLCQSKVGLIQEIRFSEPVLWPNEDVCVKLSATDEKTFRFKMPKGTCSFRFVTKSGEQKWHRLTTLGYEKILIRED